ncbi:MAG TPA: DUF4388 domain-containing protein [Thermosynechococcus sp. M98_K2018_005]|uniref:DUF4388 domain-containing protein n=1 Tax=Thermosynechococcus sp. M98_K2018_005 TaxID=2747811 RepID=UPI001A05D3E1|nr:DUF4388 domain-containing protein [Thermosynechococcus sp. M98_K2018_005]HIK36087.1 DUF4388 domain-containing protein [Thermosynechococcus sp. M98_K2018_005]
MKITGYLSEFSLGEIFRFLEQGQKTGCLSIKPGEMAGRMPLIPQTREYYIFFRLGQIVATTTSLDHQGLQRLIEQRGWLRSTTIQRLLPLCSLTDSLGLCLKAQGALELEQLQFLFKQQVLTPIPRLFSLNEGWFKFDANHPLPFEEMTGLSASPMDISLAGLRLLRDWAALMDKLPLPSSAIASRIEGQPPYRLNRHEWQVWEYANGTITLQEISDALSLPILEVQKICFRLMVVGIAEEVAGITAPSATATEPDLIETAEISTSFLEGLFTFLKTKTHTQAA